MRRQQQAGRHALNENQKDELRPQKGMGSPQPDAEEGKVDEDKYRTNRDRVLQALMLLLKAFTEQPS